jgi:ribosomal protein S18 acetylase RimI-like enzyme
VTAPQVAPWAGQPELTGLLTAYHLATEAEKGTPVASPADLPDRYRAEVLDPATTFADDVVLLALRDTTAVGCVVVTSPSAAEVELKRLWVDAGHRGQGVAGALVRAALADAGTRPVRLSVWQWRADAIALYRRLGFVECEPWDPRPGLLCLRRTT